jgi:cell division septal protein FtsQ
MRAGYRIQESLRRPERKRRNRRILAARLLLAVAAGTAPLLARPAARALGALPPFRVGRIEVEGCADLTPAVVVAAVPVKPGDNLLLVDAGKVADAVLRNARIEDAWVSRSPGTLHVRILERRTHVLVSSGTLLEIDSSGCILPPLPRGFVPDRPVVTGLRIAARRPGTHVESARLRDVLRLVTQLEAPGVDLLEEISEIAVQDGRSATLRTARDQIPMLVDPARATASQLRALAVALRDVRSRNRPVQAMDARFRGQVVIRCAPDSLRAASEQRDKV